MIERTHIPLARPPRREKKPRKPLRRTRLLRGHSVIKQMSDRRRRQRADYSPARLGYLAAHPFCQIWIARHRLAEADVIAADGWTPQGRAPAATTIHHRNKCRGARLNDERWWMSASLPMHDEVENSKDAARREGFLLPLEADKDGRCPNGHQALETPEFMRVRASR